MDVVNSCSVRVNTHMVETQAQPICEDLLQLHNLRVQNGDVDASLSPQLPTLQATWFHRWRKKYNVCYRAVNLRYKVSARKRDARIRILWCNAIRLRVFHEALFGAGKLRFVGLDQNPSGLTPRTIARPSR